MIKKILAVSRKEILQLIRDRRILPIVFISPLVQLLLFGYSVNLDLKNITIAICNFDRGAVARTITDGIVGSGIFKLKVCRDRQEVEQSLNRSQALLGIVFPERLSAGLLELKPPRLEVYIDGSDPNTAFISQGYVAEIVKNKLVKSLPPGLTMARSPVDLRLRILYNPNLSSRNFMVPGIIALILMTMTTILTAVAIVREYEKGTIEQILVTPLKPFEFLTGKLLPYILIGFFDILLVLIVGTLWFKVPIHGSVVLLLALSSLFLLSTLGFGIFVSTVSHTQQQAMMTSFFFLMPNMILSGFIFPIENMPKLIQYLTYLVPTRYYMSILRDIFLKGAGFAILWPQALALLVYGLVIFTLSVSRFRQRLD
jgi:ABC-2 type transport system permease protein